MSDDLQNTKQIDDKINDSQNAPSDKNDIENLKLALEEAKTEAQKYLEGWKRAKADYQNLKKDTDKKTESIMQTAKIFLLADFLDVYDHFKTACRSIDNQKGTKIDNVFYDGIIQIEKQFETLLIKWGVKRVETIGSKFNPEIHEAVGEEVLENNQSAEQLVVKELSAGYTLNEIVIKPAKVTVSK